jgi:hypothetical protein
MQIFLTITLCLISLRLAAAPLNPLVGCLGSEELRLHKQKRTGPVYKLNQLFLNDLVSAGDITLREASFKKVCVNYVFTPSVDLMREILLDGEKIFILSRSVTNKNLRNFQLSAIAEIERVIPHIFFSYLSDLQARTATADCFNKYIPGLKAIHNRFKYLESEITPGELLKNKARIKGIFTALKSYPEIKRKCYADKLKRDKKKNK